MYENDLDRQLEEAMEGLFSPKRKSVSDLAAEAKKNLSKKCKTMEDVAEIEAKIKSDADKFNTALKTMAKAATDFKNQKIDKGELKKIIKPISKDLKKAACILKYGQVVQDEQNVTAEDLKILKDYIAGLRKVVAEIKKELKTPTKESLIETCDNVLASLESMMAEFDDTYSNDEISIESLFEGFDLDEEISVESLFEGFDLDDSNDFYDDSFENLFNF